MTCDVRARARQMLPTPMQGCAWGCQQQPRGHVHATAKADLSLPGQRSRGIMAFPGCWAKPSNKR